VSERHHPVIDDRTFQRRRLAVLAGMLAVVLAAAPLLSGAGGDGAPTLQVAAGEETVRIAAGGSPTGIRELLSKTTTTLIEAADAAAADTTLPTTSTTTAPSEPEPEPEADPEPVGSEETSAARTDSSEQEEPEATTATAPPASTAPPTTASPPTTRAPAPTTTSAAPAPASSEGSAYDDPRSTQVWYDLAECESGGNWSIDTGNGYYGGLQFSLGTWESVGGTGYPHEHPAGTQIEMGRRLQASQGWGAWPHCSEKLGLH
jgi:hypothetical protein